MKSATTIFLYAIARDEDPEKIQMISSLRFKYSRCYGYALGIKI